MHVWSISVGAFAVNCFILEGTGKRAIVMDPGADCDAIADILREQALVVDAYILTHGHMDHISALADLHRLHPAAVYLHPADAEWAFTAANQMPPYYGVPPYPTGATIAALHEAHSQQAAGLAFDVLETPGHSPGSVCIHFPADLALFTGDTLFAGSIGRTDLPGGKHRQMTTSLQRLQQLDPSLKIYPGHGSRSTLAREQQHNPYFKHYE